ncbi:ubiquitin-like protein [Microthyrium microscopicum]|uniref:Ubiquitin-like protein n=1 Tax=Microthyrium microscopicum TaxID=703497 RepID=A0A6A6UFB3_9PEZI|nr:ubiquitin-like protein [Microthyrium microscopicum]
MLIKLQLSNEKEFEIDIEPDYTVGKIKKLIYEKEEIPADKQKLLLKGLVMKDDETASEHKLENGTKLSLILALRG